MSLLPSEVESAPLHQPRPGGDVHAPVRRPWSGTPGVRMTVRGRRMTLFGLTRPPTGIFFWLAMFGPGLIAATAGDDAGGVATYSQVGAKYGYELLWVIVLITVSLAVVQEMSARLGAATGRGLVDLIRERFGIYWALFAVAVVLLANGGVLVTEFVGIGAAAELFGLSRYIVIPVAAVLVGYLVIAGNYSRIEKVFLAMALAFFSYPIAAVLAHPNWGEVAHGALVPTFHRDPAFIVLFVGLIGTTITPYMQLFQQSAIVEKGVARRHYGPEKIDVYVGTVFSNLIAAFIVIATAATLHTTGTTDLNTAADAAQALKPVAGEAAYALFAVGLIGASLLAAGVLPLATAYSVSEAFGFRKGVNLDFRRAPAFLRLFSGIIAVTAAIALIPNVPVIQLLVFVQVLNGVLLPIMLVFLLLLINDDRLTGDLKNSRLYNLLGWGTCALVTAAVVLLLGDQFLGLFGIHLLGS